MGNALGIGVTGPIATLDAHHCPPLDWVAGGGPSGHFFQQQEGGDWTGSLAPIPLLMKSPPYEEATMLPRKPSVVKLVPGLGPPCARQQLDLELDGEETFWAVA